MTFAIQTLSLREIRLPLREPFQISSGVTTMRRIVLLHLEEAGGAAAWAECVAGDEPNYGPETVDTAWLAIQQWIAPRVLGREFGGPEEVYGVLEKDFRGHHMAKAAVEMGAWALVAEKRGRSLAKLIGGTREKIATGISIGIQLDPLILVQKAQTALQAGYCKIKIKIRPGADLEYLAAVRQDLGPEAPLMADANNAYTLDHADHLARLDRFDLLMLEQPLAWDDLVRHAELQKRLKTPICLDESVTGLDRVEDMLALGSGKIVNIKPGRVGGFTPAKAIHDLCAQNGVPVWCGGMLESGVGRAYNVALASLPNFTLPGDVSPSARYWERDIVSPEWTMDEEGMVAVPRDRPGLGVTVDEDRIADLTVRRETLSA